MANPLKALGDLNSLRKQAQQMQKICLQKKLD